MVNNSVFFSQSFYMNTFILIKMRKFRVAIILVSMVLFVLFMRSVTAQDADGDTIKDEFDACPETPRDSVLPIIRTNPEFFGCSCEQIYGKLGESLACYDIYCVPGGSLSVSKRLTTNEKIDCGPDYCLGNVLYEFAEPDFVQCVDGNIAEDFCKPKITRNSNDCILGLVAQKQIVPSVDIQISGEEEVNTNEVLVIDYYSLLLENPEVRSFLGNPSRREFDSLIEKTADSVTVSRVVSRKRVGNTDATIPYVTLTIKPISGMEIKNFAVIEILESSYREDAFIFYNKQPVIIQPTKEFVWLFDSIGEEGIIINYQINEPVEAPAETIVIGKIKNRFFLADWWPLLLIPIIGYFAYLYIMSNKD